MLPKTAACTDFVRAKLTAGLSVKDVLTEWRKLLRDPTVAAASVFAPWDAALTDIDVRNIQASTVPQSTCVLALAALCTPALPRRT